jgi:hypothetical protein
MGLLKKLTKPLSKFLDKIIPNELKPALPYLSAFAPFMMGPGIMGAGMLQRGLMSGGANILSQLAQEGSEGDVDWLSAALAGGIGSLTAPGSPGTPVGSPQMGTVGYQPSAQSFLQQKAGAMDPGWLRSGTEMLGTGAKYLTGAGKTLRTDPFSIPGMKAALVPATAGTADLARITAQQELDRLNDEAEETGIGINDEGRRVAIRAAMEAAGHLEETILDALASLGLRSGGIVSLRDGGQLVKRGPGRPGYAGDSRWDDPTMSPGTRQDYTPGQGHRDTYVAPTTKSTTKTPVITQDDLRGIMETIPTKSNLSNLFTQAKRYNPLNLLFGSPVHADEIDEFSETISTNPVGGLDQFAKDVEFMEATIPNQIIGVENMPGTVRDFYTNKNPVPPGSKFLVTPDDINFPSGTPSTNPVGGVDQFAREMEALEKARAGDIVTASELGGTLQDFYTNKNPGTDANTRMQVYDDNINFSAVNNNLPGDNLFATGPVDLSLPYHGPGQYDYTEGMLNTPDDPEILNIAAKGGRVGLLRGGDPDNYPEDDDVTPWQLQKEEGVPIGPMVKGNMQEQLLKAFAEYKAKGGTLSLKQFAATWMRENAAGGGVMGILPKGKEVDYRGGGVIPIGSRERADDVPARLSKNEFVMTADAVKAAGGGNINQGAKKMYNLMHNLEARV